MAKNKVSEWSSSPASNTDVGGIDINEGCAPSGINNAIREVMAQIKDMQAGSDGDNFTVGGNLSVTGTTTLTGGLVGTIAVANGGTGATTASEARTNLGLGTIATQASSNVTITGGSITGITDLTVADGGTGASSITANSVILGNGTSALSGNLVSPGTSGNVLTSNGTTWQSTAPTKDSMTLLGTLTTTSGTTAELTGLTLTGYKKLEIVLNNVSCGGDKRLRLNGISIVDNTGGSGESIWGSANVYLTNSVFSSVAGSNGTTSGTLSVGANRSRIGKNTVTNSTTTLTFEWEDSSAFDSGSILVYGVR